MFFTEFWMDFLQILAPFWEPFGHPLGAKIAKKGAGAKEGGGLSRRLRAEGAQGYPRPAQGDPKTHKMTPDGPPGPPK